MKPENVRCPECDGPMVSRKSLYGVFWGCRQYPKCRGTRDVNGDVTPKRIGDIEDAEVGLPSDRQRANNRRRWE